MKNLKFVPFVFLICLIGKNLLANDLQVNTEEVKVVEVADNKDVKPNVLPVTETKKEEIKEKGHVLFENVKNFFSKIGESITNLFKGRKEKAPEATVSAPVVSDKKVEARPESSVKPEQKIEEKVTAPTVETKNEKQEEIPAAPAPVESTLKTEE